MKCICFALLACFFCLPYVSLAQKNTGIEKNKLYLSPGIGVFSSYPLMKDGSMYKDYSLKVPLISLSLDIALTRHWSVGPYLAYSASGHDTLTDAHSFIFQYTLITSPSSGYEYRRYNHYQFGSKTTYHFHIFRKLSGHTGLILGYQRTTQGERNNQDHVKGPFNFYNENPRHLFINFFAGIRMPVSQNISAFAELGSYVTLLRFGCSMKLR